MTLSKDKDRHKDKDLPAKEGPDAAAPEEEPVIEAEAADEDAALKLELQKKTKEAEEYRERLLRYAAEMENLKKRLEREKADLLQFANEKLIKELLPVVDNLELALEHGRQLETPESFLEGIEMVHQGLVKALVRFGVTPIDSVGQQFDPAFHNAVMQEEAPEVPDCTVLKELQKGYLLQNRLLRPAMVVVARNPEKTSSSCGTIDSTVQEER
jgi:molecular chaperone GrpE